MGADMNKIVERIERESGVPGLVSILAGRLSPTDLQSLLLEVYRLRSDQRGPSALLSSYASDRFVRPSSVSPRRLLSWEQTAFSALPPEFQLLALSPVCPLGTSSVVATVDQNWAVATARNTEVVSDSTNVLALECAVRRRALLRADHKSVEPVHLATSHRLLRAQRYANPDFVSHFSAFAMCSAGRDRGDLRFELSALGLQVRFYLQALGAFLGPDVPLHLSLTDFGSPARYSLLETRLLSPLRSEFDTVDCVIDALRTGGRGYYRDLCFHIHATHPSGRRMELVDGGSVDWTRRLLSNAKERLIISGIGSERLCSEF
jgi:hypothetical protein